MHTKGRLNMTMLATLSKMPEEFLLFKELLWILWVHLQHQKENKIKFIFWGSQSCVRTWFMPLMCVALSLFFFFLFQYILLNRFILRKICLSEILGKVPIGPKATIECLSRSKVREPGQRTGSRLSLNILYHIFQMEILHLEWMHPPI